MSVKLSNNQQNVKIAMHKSLLKEFNRDLERVVYLENGDEFQIQIFNDQTTEIGAMIYINGEVIGSSLLVIRPGERVWLERYLDNNSKFKFSTYEVNGNNEAVKKAIANNGVVEVKLYRKMQSCFSWPYYKTYYSSGIITDSPSTYPSPYEPQILYCCNESTNFTASTPMNGIVDVETTNISAPVSLGSAATFTCTAGSSLDSAACTSTSSLSLDSAASGTVERKSNKIETGRIVEGSESDQEFDYVDIQFESFPFSTEKIHILPKSTKPVYSNELQKIYCHSCGRKLKTKFNFCPFCGAKQ